MYEKVKLLRLPLGKSCRTDVSLNDEQVEQLEKLREETSKAGKTL